MSKTSSTALSFTLIGVFSMAGLWMDPTTVSPSLARAPTAEPPPLSPDLPAYPGSWEVPIGTGVNINGQTVSMHQFFSSDPADEIASFYVDALRPTAGRSLIAYQVANARYVGFTNDAAQFVQVMILEQNDGTSLVIPSTASGTILPGTEARSMQIPFPSDHRNLVSSRSVEQGRASVSAQFVSSLDLEQLASFYRRALPPLGYTQAPGALLPEEISKTGILRFKGSNGTRLTISAQVLPSEGGTLVYIIKTRPTS